VRVVLAARTSPDQLFSEVIDLRAVQYLVRRGPEAALPWGGRAGRPGAGVRAAGPRRLALGVTGFAPPVLTSGKQQVTRLTVYPQWVEARIRVTRLLGEAIGAAESITDHYEKALALCNLAEAVAATDPDRAARLLGEAIGAAQSITYESSKALALISVAEALAATDPDRAARLLNDAERLALSVTDEASKGYVLCNLTKAVAATDPDRALRLANSITYGGWKAIALGDVAGALAATDPDRALRLADSISDESLMAKASARISVAGALAATGPDRAARLLDYAERIAQSITDNPYSKALMLRDIANAWSQG
jgi:hypothetical protein